MGRTGIGFWILDFRFGLMTIRNWTILYLAILSIDLFAVYTGNETVRYGSKSMLMPLLIGLFAFSTKGLPSSLKKWIVLALTFSWLGDVFLLFEGSDDLYFLAGLVAFLVAHVWYLILFKRITKLHGVQVKFLPIIIGIIYYFGFMYVLKPSTLGSFEWPVRIYGAVLLLMFMAALHMAYISKPACALLVIAGASLFVISDSLLAMNKFYKQFEYAGIAVMLTYGTAQLLITLGATKYINSSSHKFADSEYRS